MIPKSGNRFSEKIMLKGKFWTAASGRTAFDGGERARDGRDEMRTRFRHGEAARREGVPIEKKSSHGKGVGEIAAGCWRGIVTQEGRQGQKLVAVLGAARARDGAAGALLHVDQVGGCSIGGAGAQ